MSFPNSPGTASPNPGNRDFASHDEFDLGHLDSVSSLARDGDGDLFRLQPPPQPGAAQWSSVNGRLYRSAQLNQQVAIPLIQEAVWNRRLVWQACHIPTQGADVAFRRKNAPKTQAMSLGRSRTALPQGLFGRQPFRVGNYRYWFFPFVLRTSSFVKDISVRLQLCSHVRRLAAVTWDAHFVYRSRG